MVRLDPRMAEAAEVAVAEIVGEQDDDVGFRSGDQQRRGNETDWDSDQRAQRRDPGSPAGTLSAAHTPVTAHSAITAAGPWRQSSVGRRPSAKQETRSSFPERR